MAATVSVSRSQFQAVAFAGFRGRLVDITFAASDYPTGGYAISANSLLLNEIVGAIQCGINSSAVTVNPTFVYNRNTGKLQAFGAAGGATGLTEIGNNGDISLQTVTILFLGV